MIQSGNFSRQGARLAAAIGLLASTATASLAATPTIAVGQYYTTELVTGLTGSGGVTDAICAEAYVPAGTQSVAFTHVTTTKGVAAFNVRLTQAGSSSLSLEHQVLTQGSGSTLLNQSGTLTLYINGKQALPPAPYTAALTIVDTVSFAATLTVQLPSPTGTGTCSQVVDATFVLAD